MERGLNGFGGFTRISKKSYLLNKPGKSIALTGRIGEIRPVLGQCDALRPEILR